MNGLVPIQTLAHKPRERRANSRRVIHGQLRFHNRVNDGVCPGGFYLFAHVPMETLNKEYPFLFIELKPLRRLGSVVGIIAFHLALTLTVPSNECKGLPRPEKTPRCQD